MLGLQPVESTIERADGNSPFSTLLDLMPNGNAIGVVTQPDHRQQDDLFKLAERLSGGAHTLDLQSRINSRPLQGTIVRWMAQGIRAPH